MLRMFRKLYIKLYSKGLPKKIPEESFRFCKKLKKLHFSGLYKSEINKI